MFLFPNFQISSEIKSKFKPLGEDEAIRLLAELPLGQMLEFLFFKRILAALIFYLLKVGTCLFFFSTGTPGSQAELLLFYFS